MGYVEYVESCILESGLEETGELLEILESAETYEDVEAIEDYLTEKKDNSEKWASRKDIIKNAHGLNKAYLKARATAGHAAENFKKSRLARNTEVNPERTEYIIKVNNRNKVRVSSDGPSSGPTDYYNTVLDWEGEKAYTRATKAFDTGAVVAGAAAFYAFGRLIISKIQKEIKKNKEAIPEKVQQQYEQQLRELTEKFDEIKTRAKNGEISGKEAKLETKKIDAKINAIVKEIAHYGDKKPTATKESVDITDLQLDIFEAYESGNITEEDRDELLTLLEGGENATDGFSEEMGDLKSEKDNATKKCRKALSDASHKADPKLIMAAAAILLLFLNKLRKSMNTKSRAAKVDTITKSIDVLKGRIQDVREDLDAGRISEESAIKRIKEYEKEIDALMKRIEMYCP